MSRWSVLVVFVLLAAATPALASYQCCNLTREDVCRLRDGNDMAVCEHSYCGTAAYDCQTCPGLLDAGVDLKAPIVDDRAQCQMADMQVQINPTPGAGSGCDVTRHGTTGGASPFAVLVFLCGAVLVRRARRLRVEAVRT